MLTNQPIIYTGEMLRKLRLHKNIKQTEAAKKLGISQQAYSLIERSDNIGIYKLNRILQFLGSNLEEFNKITTFLYNP